MRHAAGVGAIILAGGALGAQERKFKKNYAQDGVWWASSWEEALKEAQARNAPIHFTQHRDD